MKLDVKLEVGGETPSALDIKNNRHLAEHKLINVEVLRDQMVKLHEILERWVYQVDDVLDFQIERRSEYGAKKSSVG